MLLHKNMIINSMQIVKIKQQNFEGKKLFTLNADIFI